MFSKKVKAVKLMLVRCDGWKNKNIGKKVSCGYSPKNFDVSVTKRNMKEHTLEKNLFHVKFVADVFQRNQVKNIMRELTQMKGPTNASFATKCS